MPRYLWKIRYTADGLNGLRKEGGSARAEIARKLLESAGGKLHSYDFAFGDVDAYAVAEAPSNAAAAAAATTVSAAGGATVETVVLLSPAEVDEAVKAQTDYRKPGA